MTDKIKVGDELAFRVDYGSGWTIQTVERITPSGRIVTKNYTMDPDLKIRGRTSWGPRRGEPVTDEIRQLIQRRRNRQAVTEIRWQNQSDEVIEQVLALVKGGEKG